MQSNVSVHVDTTAHFSSLLLAHLMGQYFLLAGVCRRLLSVVVVCRRL